LKTGVPSVGGATVKLLAHARSTERKSVRAASTFDVSAPPGRWSIGLRGGRTMSRQRAARVAFTRACDLARVRVRSFANCPRDQGSSGCARRCATVGHRRASRARRGTAREPRWSGRCRRRGRMGCGDRAPDQRVLRDGSAGTAIKPSDRHRS